MRKNAKREQRRQNVGGRPVPERRMSSAPARGSRTSQAIAAANKIASMVNPASSDSAGSMATRMRRVRRAGDVERCAAQPKRHTGDHCGGHGRDRRMANCVLNDSLTIWAECIGSRHRGCGGPDETTPPAPRHGHAG